MTYSANHTIEHSSLIEEYFWTYGCTPTASAMVLSYWDSSHWDINNRWKYNKGMGRLIDYYFIDECSGYNVPNTIVELKNALDTDYNTSSCSGDGATEPWDIDNGIAAVTNLTNGYQFNSYKACSATWPEVFGDWCWDNIKQEINLNRPFVWSTGIIEGFKGHSVVAWGYTDSKYVILYDTWSPGREYWYYKYYLGDPDNSIESTQVNSVNPPNSWDDSDIVLDDPIGEERLYVGSNYQIFWYMWGSLIDHVDIYYSLDSGRSWDNLIATHPMTYSDGWGRYNWNVPDTPSDNVRIRIMAYDSDNNYIAGDGSYADFRILHDTSSPLGSINIDGGEDYTNDPSVILTLSCTDDPIDDASGCTEMRFSNDNAAWTPWYPYATSKEWTLTNEDGTKTVYVQYKDGVGNNSAIFSDTIILDTTGPSGSISINNGAVIATSRSVILNMSCSGCSEMRFLSRPLWGYNDPVWTAWEPYAPTKAWTLSSTNDGYKIVKVQFRDIAGNTSIFYDTIILDTEAPTGLISINNGAAYTNDTSSILTLSCRDSAIGCSEMRLSNDSATWTAWEPYATSKQWTLTNEDGTKTVYVQYKDGVGHNSAIFSDTIILDTTPEGKIFINGGADYATSRSVILGILCINCSEMCFSNDNTTWTAWEPYVTSKQWTLTNEDGTKTVYVQFKNVAGRMSAVFSDTIILDAEAPTGTISINNGIEHTNTSSVTLTLSCSDSTSGCTEMRFSNDNATWTAWEPYVAREPSKQWTLTSGDGTKTVYVQYKDLVDNVSTSFSDTIVFEAILSIYTIDDNLLLTGNLPFSSSIAIDSNNKVHISYISGNYPNPAGYNLKYITNAYGSWVSSTIDSQFWFSFNTSIAVDSNNKVHISYNDSEGILKYATNAGGVWELTTIDPNGSNMRGYTSIAVDSNDKVHISYNDTEGVLKYATNAGGDWELTTIDPNGNTQGYASIALDSNNKVHISYIGSGEQPYGTQLRYATNVSDSWAIYIIHGSPSALSYTSIAIDSNNYAHISYEEQIYPNSPLMYATNASGSWNYSTVERTGNVGHYSSIAVDSNNKVHISYQDYTTGDLKYATNASDSWFISTVDSEGFVGKGASIAVDSNNKVHISYSKGINDLKYATNDSDGDGLSDNIENAFCTDPYDADTDDDGILDGVEDANHNGLVDTNETDPCNIDTDGDGIQDGTELGYTLADIGPDTDTSVFQPDLDPTTTTDPLDPDTDGDGISDGEEDTNHNGRVDPGETDPNPVRTMPWLPLLLLDD